MNKTVKRVVIAVSAVVIVCAVIWGAMVLFRNAQKKPVNVYAVSDFAMTDYWGDSSETSGLVTTDKLQKIMISDTQKVSEVFVETGQSVKAGDVLLSYDTTLSSLEIKKAEIELQRQKMQLTTAEKELKKLKAMKPYSSVLITPDNNINYQTQNTPFKLRGTGTKDDPVYYLWEEGNTLGEEMFREIFGEEEYVTGDDNSATDGAEDSDNGEISDEGAENREEINNNSANNGAGQEKYVVLVVREHNALNGQVLDKWGIKLKKLNGNISMQLFTPELPDEIQQYEEEKEPYYEESGSEYTAAELAQLRGEKAQEINDLKIAVKIAELDFEKMKKETEDGKVASTIDGTVTIVRDPDEAYKNGEPVIEVSGGGGYYINGAMSELEMETVEIGQTVQVNSWMTGSSCEGEIREIFKYPESNMHSYSGGNTNVSYYPFSVFVDESAGLQEGEYVNITYKSQAQAEDCMYLENQFIRTENGKSYIYVRNEEGTLEKRNVQAGKDLYGSYTQILGGITIDDYVAFPYGNDVYEGAKTKEATMDEFYGY